MTVVSQSTRHQYPDLVPDRVRQEWAAQGCYPGRDLYALFAEHVAAAPQRTAILDQDGELDYAGLDTLARSLAAGLVGIGVRPGEVVATQLPNGRLACAADLAIAAAGAIALPFPVGRGDREAASLLGRSGAVAVLTVTAHGDYPCAAKLRSLELPSLRTVVAVGAGTPAGCVQLDDVLVDPGDFVAVQSDPDGPARIVVTSGSEAAPKMVLYSHNALAGGRGRFMAELRGDLAELRSLFLVPLASAFGSNGTSVTLARHGGTLLVLSKFEAGAALELIGRGRPTHLFAVPTMVRMMLDHQSTVDSSSLRAVVLGGAALDGATAERARVELGCPVVNLYGSADGVNCHTAVDDPPARANTVGRPNPAVAEIRIVDEDLRPVPDGQNGEIIARGPMTPLCYVGAPELNVRYRTAGGWVRTGDLGRIDADGYLSVVGRGKDVVIRGGLNISPAEVEALLTAHPAVADVACVPVPDELLGERLCACVVPRANTVVTLADLTVFLATQGLEPRKFPERLLVLPAFPLSAAGKVDRRALQTTACETPTP